MSKLSSLVDLSGGNMIEIVLHNVPAHQPDVKTWYETIQKTVFAAIEPLMKSHMEGLKLSETLSKITELKLLEEFEVDYVPLSIREHLAATIDSFEELSDLQKVFLLQLFLPAFLRSGQNYVDSQIYKRAQEIQSNKGRIIQMN